MFDYFLSILFLMICTVSNCVSIFFFYPETKWSYAHVALLYSLLLYLSFKRLKKETFLKCWTEVSSTDFENVNKKYSEMFFYLDFIHLFQYRQILITNKSNFSERIFINLLLVSVLSSPSNDLLRKQEGIKSS